MRHLDRRFLLVPVLSLATLAACAGDDAGPVGPAAVPLATHTTIPCHDDVAPLISNVSATPNRLWPPNHKFVTVVVSFDAVDPFSCVSPATVSKSIVGVSSDEPVNGLGDGNTAPDWIITSSLTVLLRSERSGLGDGRTYTITVAAVDAAGNTTLSTVTVVVPHDQRKTR